MYRLNQSKILLYLIMILLFTSFVAAQPQLLIKSDHTTNKITNLQIIEYNQYYSLLHDDLFSHEHDESDLKLITKRNDIVLESAQPFSHDFIYPIDPTTNRITISTLTNQNIILDKQINLCNNNQICEPCLKDDASCTNYESALTCSDCTPSAQDNFCNIKQDNICDPDCAGLEAECDSTLAPTETLQPNEAFECTQLHNGIICDAQLCTGDSIQINDQICCLESCSQQYDLESQLTQIYQANQQEVQQHEHTVPAKEVPREQQIPSILYLTLGFIIVLLIIVIIFVRREKNRQKKLMRKIGMLLSQYNYDQIRAILKEQGHNQKQVDAAINTHHLKVKSYYEKQFKK